MKMKKFGKVNIEKPKITDGLNLVDAYARNGSSNNAASAGLIAAGSITAPVAVAAGVASLGVSVVTTVAETALSLVNLPTQLLTTGCLALTQRDNGFVKALGYTGAIIFGIPTAVISLVEEAVSLVGTGLLYVTDTTFSICSFPLALGILRLVHNRENTKDLKYCINNIREEICDNILNVDSAAKVDDLKIAVVIGDKDEGQEVTFVASNGDKQGKTYEIKYGLTDGYVNTAFELDFKNIKKSKQMNIEDKLRYLHRLSSFISFNAPSSFDVIVNGEKVDTNIEEKDELTYTAENGDDNNQNL